MKISELIGVIQGELICGDVASGQEISTAFASDLMSDVLTIQVDNVLLLTGLANSQALRTAEMSNINCIIFVRNKKVNSEMIELAIENGMVLISSPYSMFKTSGLLFSAGINPVY